MKMTSKEYADSLRLIADFYEAHPEIPVPWDNVFSVANMDEREEAQKLMRALGACEKRYLDDYMLIEKPMGVLKFSAIFQRTKVCTRRVVGVETVPAKFIAAHTEPATTREIVEWDCGPVLEPVEQPVATA